MPYKTRFQHERDAKFQERMREMWRNKKRRQRRKRAAAAKKAKEEGKPVPRDPNVFIRSRAFPNKALWLLDRERQQARAQGRTWINPEYIKRAWRLSTTHFWIRTNPLRGYVLGQLFASIGLGVRRRGTLYTRPKTNTPNRGTSYVDRGRLTAPQTVKVTTMVDPKTKFDPENPIKTTTDAIREVIESTPRNYPPGRWDVPPSKTQENAPSKEELPRKSGVDGLGMTPEQRQKRLEYLRAVLLESEKTEQRARDADESGAGGSVPRDREDRS